MKKLFKRVAIWAFALIMAMSVSAVLFACDDPAENDGPPTTEQEKPGTPETPGTPEAPGTPGTPETPDTPETPEKVKDGVAITVTVGGDGATITVSEYITAHGQTVTVDSSAPDKATATLEDGVVTVMPVAEGSTTVTLACGDVVVTFAVTVNAAEQPDPPLPPETQTPALKKDSVTDAEVHDLYEGEVTVDLAENIENADLITGYTVNDAQAAGTTFTIDKDYGEYGETPVDVTLNVVATYDGDSLEYTYNLKLSDTTAYRIVNGGFENGLEGWKAYDAQGTEKAEFAGRISEETTYWDADLPYSNDGKYYIVESATQEIIESSRFKVGNSGWVSFKIGSMRPYDEAGLRKIYVQAVKEVFDGEDTVIATVRNVQWSDPAHALELMPYAIDLSDYLGDTVYFRIVDLEAAAENFRDVVLDSFDTWHDAQPADCTDMSELSYYDTEATIDLKSGNSVTVAPVLYTGVGALSEHVGEVIEETEAVTVNGLTVTATEEGTYHIVFNKDTDCEFTVTLAVIDTTVGYSVVNGDFESGTYVGWTYTVANGSTDFGRVIGDDYYWNNPENIFGKQGRYVFGGVETSAGTNQESGMGTLRSSNFMLKQNGWISFLMGGAHNAKTGVRVYTKEGVLLAEFNNQGKGHEAVLDLYKYRFSGMDAETECYIEVFDLATGGWGLVVVDDFRTDWGDTEPDGTLITPVYRKGQTQVYNGGFDENEIGWEITTTHNGGDVFGFIGAADAMWGDANDLKSYNNDGKFLQNGKEESKGYALSSAFEVSQNGWMTFKIGGNGESSYVAIVDADTGEELAKFVNKNFVGAWPNQGWEMYAYKVNLIESGITAGRRVRIKVVDDATSGYGVITADSFVTAYEEEPADATFEKIDKV